ncbi:MAG: hypothetical protein JRE40_15965 [Deltaproteobacteria bacterium]|nr:hypothetical protein [Deltaproteobacteria bacterium]MBW2674623.1 hypothetical protein [Deltaproteobacteria bacterium]
MKAHCPKCGKFVSSFDTAPAEIEVKWWIFRRKYKVVVHAFWCVDCDYDFSTATTERLR